METLAASSPYTGVAKRSEFIERKKPRAMPGL
jgi:hypothetical protein